MKANRQAPEARFADIGSLQPAVDTPPNTRQRFMRLQALPILLALGLACLVAVTYQAARHNDFHFDDLHNIRENAAVRMERFELAALHRAAFESPLEFRKLAYVTFALDWWRGGGSPATFQQTNVALHALNAVLVFALLALVASPRDHQTDGTTLLPAFWAAALWASHPIQVQSVTYIVQRMNQLACLFTLLAVLCYLAARLRARTRLTSTVLFVLCGLAMLGGALSKENAWIAPALLVLAELGVVRDNSPLFRTAAEKALLLAVLLTLAVLMGATMFGAGPVAEHFATGYDRRDFTMSERLLTQPRVVGFHLGQILWPLPERFSLEHDFVLSTSLTTPLATLPALLLTLVWCALGVWLLWRRGRRTWGFWMLWLPGTLAIESSFVPLEMIFEHRMYLPSVGLFGVVSLGLKALWDRVERPVLALSLPTAMLVVLLSASTMARLPVWRTPGRLAEHSVQQAPGSSRAWSGLGLVHLRAGKTEAAEEAFRRSLSLDSKNRWALEFLGVILLDRGEIQLALDHFRRALILEPDRSSLINHLGEAFMRLGDYGQAEKHFSRAAELKPWVPAYYWNRALALEELQRCEEARADWQTYLEVETEPDEIATVRAHLRTEYETETGRCYASTDSTN